MGRFTAAQKKAWKEQKQEEQRKMIEDAVENIASSKGWQDWIRYGRNNLKKYSFQNALLIHWQYPTATLTKGRTTWMNEGYLVNDDAKPINILAPQMVNLTDEEGNVVYGDDGKPKKRVGWYRVVSVYDVSQTNAPKDYLPKQAYVTLDGDEFVNLVPKLEGFARELGWLVRYTEEKTDHTALVDETLHEIRIPTDTSVNQVVYTLVKELARVYGDVNEIDYGSEAGMVIVESAACLALGQLGFDTRKASVPFIAAHDHNLKEFRSFANTVEDIAKTLAEKMK